MLITLLGTGTSHGVPVLGCDCQTCISDDPRDIRTRSSVYITTGTAKILIDTATELRIQSLKNRVNRVDLVLITHCHADHVAGFDDLRRFNELQGGEIPVYGNSQSLAGIRQMFPYVFDDKAQLGGGKPKIRLTEVNSRFEAGGTHIIPIPVWHGRIPVNGYRIGNFAYVTDVSEIPDSSMELLRDLEILVLGVLRYKPHPTHFNLETGLEIIRLLKPRRSLLTHICHDFKHSELNRRLPDGVELAYDGEQIEL
jgi:phosphoribosyl 1,2-cyclic phosphate phosphodiesterase